MVTYDDYFTYFLHLHLPHTAYPSHLRIIGHEGHEPTVNPTLLWDTPNQVFKHVGDARSVVVLVLVRILLFKIWLTSFFGDFKLQKSSKVL